MSQLLASASIEQSQPDLAGLGLEAHRAARSALNRIQALNPEAADAAALAALKAELSTTLEHLSTTTETLLTGMGVSLDPVSVDEGGDIFTLVFYLYLNKSEFARLRHRIALWWYIF